jgi:hypothetical protein
MDGAIPDKHPSFHDLRLRHRISLDALSAYAKREISWETIQMFDETGRANPYIADDLLFALSELTGQSYTRTNVGGIIFVLAPPPAAPIRPQPLPGRLPARPTLFDLFMAYRLDIDWVGEALGLDDWEIWRVIEDPLEEMDRPVIGRFLSLVSRYTGVISTWERIQLGAPAPANQEQARLEFPESGCQRQARWRPVPLFRW